LASSGNQQTPGLTVLDANGQWDAPGFVTSISLYNAVGPQIVVAGLFSQAFDVTLSNIGIWNEGTQTWSALGAGLSSYAYATAVSGNNIYAGGLFAFAGDDYVNNIAMWSGKLSEWEPLGTGIDGAVLTIYVESSTSIYAGGQFTSAGGRQAFGVAKWDGKDWYPLPCQVCVTGCDYSTAQSLNFYTCPQNGAVFIEIKKVSSKLYMRYTFNGENDLYEYTGSYFIKQNENGVSFPILYPSHLITSSITFPGEEPETAIVGAVVTTTPYSGLFGATPNIGVFDPAHRNWEFVSKAGFSGASTVYVVSGYKD